MDAPRAALSSALGSEPRLVRLDSLDLKVAGNGSVADSPAAAHDIRELLAHHKLKLGAHNHHPRLHDRGNGKRALRVVIARLEREVMGLLEREMIKIIVVAEVV